MILRDQQQAGGRRGGVFAGHLHPHVGGYQRLDAIAARGLIKLDGAKQVAQVTDGQGGLPVCSGGGGDFINAVGTVNDGEFGMDT